MFTVVHHETISLLVSLNPFQYEYMVIHTHVTMSFPSIYRYLCTCNTATDRLKLPAEYSYLSYRE